MRAVGVQYLDIASSHLDIALPHLDIALSHPLRSAVVLLLQLNNLSNHLATGNKKQDESNSEDASQTSSICASQSRSEIVF